MRSKVKRNNKQDFIPIVHKSREVDINLNEEADEPVPLEYNFSTKNAILNKRTYTFSFPEMWRTSKNKNIIGIRKISYFKGRSELRFTLGFLWVNTTSNRHTCFINPVHNTFSSDATMTDIKNYLNQIIEETYERVKTDYKTELQHIYKFEYIDNILILKKYNIGEEIKIQHDIIMLADESHLSNRDRTFFKLDKYQIEHKVILDGKVIFDLYYYNLIHYAEFISERKADSCKVCCSFVPQSDIQYVGLVGETFIPIKYYNLQNENRYFTMNLKTFDNDDIVLPGLENDSLIIEAQLL